MSGAKSAPLRLSLPNQVSQHPRQGVDIKAAGGLALVCISQLFEGARIVRQCFSDIIADGAVPLSLSANHSAASSF